MEQGTVNAKKKGKTHEKGHKNQALSRRAVRRQGDVPFVPPDLAQMNE